MRWRGRRMSGNIEDRRGAGGGFRVPIGGRGLPRGRRAGGIGGIGLVLVMLLLGWVLGIDPLTLLEDGPGMAPQSAPQGQVGAPTAADDEMTRFVATVLADTEDTWQAIFERAGQSYREPTLVLFDNSVRSACGFASAASGPFYCPGDQKMYIDLGFYRELERRFGAPGDFAQAYVLAHEVGHHVQNLIGVLPRFNEMRRGMSEAQANEMSVRVELQADCFAGLWAHHTGRRGLLERGDLDEALNAAAQIGDDAIQRRTQGYVVPESFNHGASEQRARWFLTGYENGSMQACDTFNADRL
jgi:predicted metalloprotease